DPKAPGRYREPNESVPWRKLNDRKFSRHENRKFLFAFCEMAIPHDPGDTSTMTQAAARTLVFFSSAAVLVIEILAQRLLAPYLGASPAVVTGVLRHILDRIAVCAWAGGQTYDYIQ